MRALSIGVMLCFTIGATAAQSEVSADSQAAAQTSAATERKPPMTGSGPGAAPPGVIRLDETVISGNQELPKVLYILPWRDPSGLPDIDLDAHYSEVDVFRRLYPPSYRRELTYFESLEAAKSPRATANSSKE